MAGIKIPRTLWKAFMKLNEVEMLKAIHNTTQPVCFQAKLAVVNALKR
jgi:hypothetical protein